MRLDEQYGSWPHSFQTKSAVTLYLQGKYEAQPRPIAECSSRPCGLFECCAGRANFWIQDAGQRTGFTDGVLDARWHEGKSDAKGGGSHHALASFRRVVLGTRPRVVFAGGHLH